MIRSYFGLSKIPFNPEGIELLPHQCEVLEILLAHSQQGGLCVVAGEPGTGKSVLRAALQRSEPRRLSTPLIGRTLHTYTNTVRILCQAFQIDFDGRDHSCERRLIEEAFRLHRLGKVLVILVDDAQLMHIDCLRRLRLLLAEFPPSHCLVLFGQVDLLTKLKLTVNQDINSRISYSVLLRRIPTEAVANFVLTQFDRCGLPHHTLDEDALALIARSSDGLLRAARNLTLSTLIEAVRAQQKQIGIDLVNKALMQPHWRRLGDIITATLP
jgi:type II secretory pathway predicted ATPase ExeA